MSLKLFLSRVTRIILALLMLFPAALPALRVKATPPVPPSTVSRAETPVIKPQASSVAPQLKTPRAQDDVPIVEEAEQIYNWPAYSHSTIPHPNGKSALIGGYGTTFPLVDTATAQVKQVFHTNAEIHSAVFSPDGSKLLLNNSLYDVASGAKIQTFVIEGGGSGSPQAGDISQSHLLQVRELEPLYRPADMAQGVRPLVPVFCGVRHLADADAVQNNDDNPPHNISYSL